MQKINTHMILCTSGFFVPYVLPTYLCKSFYIVYGYWLRAVGYNIDFVRSSACGADNVQKSRQEVEEFDTGLRYIIARLSGHPISNRSNFLGFFLSRH